MKHLGDITKISGHTAPTVDVIIGGSPCQDLSIAGKRAGLDGERSGLFMEQIRIIKEMRENDIRCGRTSADVRPRYMVWENVPGAFSSNKGEDFRIVLEETAKVADKDASVPMPDKGKWTTSGCIMGDGWSIAWRVLDAQFWGVPQRRRRIALIADFGGQSAPEILFVRKSVSGDTEQSKQERKRTSSDAEGSFGADDREGVYGFDAYNQQLTGDVAQTIRAIKSDADHVPCTVYSVENHPADSRVDIDTSGKVQTLTSRMGTGGGNVPMVMEEKPVICLQGNGIDRADTAGCNGAGWREGASYTLNTIDRPAVAYGLDRASFNQGQNAKFDFTVSEEQQPTITAKGPGAVAYGVDKIRYIVRRLTPLECERLQGFPDGWTDIGDWVDSKGKLKKTSDAARYKALGNSIAIPPWKWVMKRLCACYERDATMASLFDGIGGFPYIWERINGKGSCLWASEIEEFPIAVTKVRFGECT